MECHARTTAHDPTHTGARSGAFLLYATCPLLRHVPMKEEKMKQDMEKEEAQGAENHAPMP